MKCTLLLLWWGKFFKLEYRYIQLIQDLSKIITLFVRGVTESRPFKLIVPPYKNLLHLKQVNEFEWAFLTLVVQKTPFYSNIIPLKSSGKFPLLSCVWSPSKDSKIQTSTIYFSEFVQCATDPFLFRLWWRAMWNL